ncbi:MAG: hypothetical protein A2Y76_01065 [Planctomycetes bacterium RBG_13_60_9]|nr:MAG: hypothetical protein A2Y76_01065 [Planctomycetes bacterium RBG_13_60_9]
MTSQEARVSSVLVLRQLGASLVTFAETVSVALEEAGADVQRTRRWLAEDRYRYWRTQVQVRAERFTQAQLALKQREVFDRTLSGTPSSCVDERKALKMAQGQLQEAEHKLSRVKAWSQQIERELSDYRGAVQRLVSALEVDIPNARARLDKMIDSLEAYLALAPPEMPRSASEESVVDIVRPGEVQVQPPADNQSPAPQDPQEGDEVLRKTKPSPNENTAL